MAAFLEVQALPDDLPVSSFRLVPFVDGLDVVASTGLGSGEDEISITSSRPDMI